MEHQIIISKFNEHRLRGDLALIRRRLADKGKPVNKHTLEKFVAGIRPANADKFEILKELMAITQMRLEEAAEIKKMAQAAEQHGTIH